ncbi:sensor domain-containing diguanylate cyclase [Azospirillum sp. SYSU D00513]|uniref:sensor domain-containing diguanylate cyclase n=1 Tax=Azospirillum sp. SYSU D00513 TaxID=2812561 RepID=UPI001A95718C|nr:sensor domain-containing diguanylate cyclase [Azospirillum sp. SYSU D00513]
MKSPALTIVGVYAASASLWVLGSDLAVDRFLEADSTFAQSAKGMGFVLVTSLVLWLFLRRAFALYTAKESALREAMARVQRSESDLRSILDNLPDAFYRVDMKGTITMVSPHFAREFGYELEEVIGTNLADYYLDPGGRARFLEALRANGGRVQQHRIAMRRKDGSPLWVSVNALIRHDESGTPVGVEGIGRNITEQHALEDRLRHLASHDMLTGLCNRIRFEDRLTHAIARARRDGQPLALLYLDLDGFKTINDTHGHHTGDEILVTVARRLTEALRDSDTTARMGGDEFAVLLEGGITAEAAATVARKIVETVSTPLPGLDERISTSVGIALYPRDGSDGDTLLKSADKAMYHAKRTGKNRSEAAV